MRTILLSRLPTSAPAPPPRLRLVSGLLHAISRIRDMQNKMTLTSDSLGREDDDEAQKKAAYQYQERAPDYVALAEQVSAPEERERDQHSEDDNAEKKQHAPGVQQGPENRTERNHEDRSEERRVGERV